MKPWMTFRRLESFFLICLDRVARICSCSSATVASRSIFVSASRTASAPILATKESSPYSSSAWRYSVSVRSCLLLERGLARVDHHVVLVVDDALERAGGHVEQQAEAARHALQEPDVGDRHGELDVAHALAAHAGDRHLDAAAVADHVLVLDALVLAAGALVVAHRAEDLLAEQAARLGLEGAVVDRLGILDLALATTCGCVSGEATVMDTQSNGLSSRPRTERASSRVCGGCRAGWIMECFPELSLMGRRGVRPAAQAPRLSASRFCSLMSRPRDWISLMRTLKDSGVPACSVLSPLTSDS